MKKLFQLFAALAVMIAMMTACDVNAPNPSDLAGLWGGAKIDNKHGDIEASIKFTPSAEDSTRGEFVIWYEGTFNEEDDAGKFSIDFGVSDPGTYKVEGDRIVLTYDAEKVGVKLDEDDVRDHAEELQEAGEEGSVEAIAEDFENMFGSYLHDSFKKLFQARNGGDNRHTFIIEGDKLTLKAGDVNDLIFTRQEEE
ncbi:MAG: hypothetical protein IKX39_02245 [Muribaculaceae bacterium]|nr:hypothetical protein [Muribaculaceae bacterium]